MKKKQTRKTNKDKIKRREGFTLIEMVLVVGLTGLVFASTYSLFTTTIKQDTENRFELIAANLAQEGIEIIRNIRDENVMKTTIDKPNNNDDKKDIGEGLNIDGNCFPYLTEEGVSSCDGESKFIIEENSGDNIVRYVNCNSYNGSNNCSNPPKKTRFSRWCKITDETGTEKEFKEKLKVVCTVEWDSFIGAGEDGKRKIEAEAILTNWQE